MFFLTCSSGVVLCTDPAHISMDDEIVFHGNLYIIVIPHFIYFQIYYISVKFDKAPVSNKMTFPPSDSLLPEPFMLSLSHIHRKKLSMEEGDPNKKDRSHHP